MPKHIVHIGLPERPTTVRSCRPQGFVEWQLWVDFGCLVISYLESVPRSEFGTTTDIRQTAGYDIWLAAVLTLSANYGHTAQSKTAPKGRLA